VRIAIIGAGDVGSAIARAAVRTGHPVTLTAAKSDTARQAADEVGATPGASNADAAHNADVVVLAVPFAAVPSVAEEIRDAAAGKIVIDATNPLKADMSGLATGKRSAAEELQEQITGRSGPAGSSLARPADRRVLT
jgi:8-hydroxy-5-deazaflavin:NADPH oxidoreductase